MINKLIIGSDHLGKDLKDSIKTHLESKGIEVNDIGVKDSDQVDYPDIGKILAEKIQKNDYERGILVCGTGAGMAIVANKFSGIRAVCVNDAYTAERSIASNNAQIITFGALITGVPNALMYTDIWLKNNFQSERSGKKVDKINDLDS
ncbi:MAG: ribose-5-phosphate isomerase [Flammeovirgaceae bacterium]|nr:ribose-5-phosphate isomerase [Flammeovirgaceae bacterium]